MEISSPSFVCKGCEGELLCSKWLAARTSLCIFDQAASFERGFCSIFKCTRVLVLVAMPSQNPSLPFDSVQACLHGRECVHFGQQAKMWFYTYSSRLCPQRVNCLRRMMQLEFYQRSVVSTSSGSDGIKLWLSDFSRFL